MPTLIKGAYNGLCNRTACQQPGAVFFNWSTQLYYCPSCAKLINDVNHTDALRMYGHELCTLGEYGAEPELPNIDDPMF